jgi:protein-S-isoprenylcysteine O-methyltransferase Ste14
LLILDWNTWIFNDETRFIIGIPLSVIGALLVSWGIITLGASNTSGLKRGLELGGPYQFTRNPQYLGDMILFIGVSILANSNYLFIAHVLLILIFMIIPLAEETWLEEQYGDAYLNYKRNVSRFL